MITESPDNVVTLSQRETMLRIQVDSMAGLRTADLLLFEIVIIGLQCEARKLGKIVAPAGQRVDAVIMIRNIRAGHKRRHQQYRIFIFADVIIVAASEQSEFVLIAGF